MSYWYLIYDADFENNDYNLRTQLDEDVTSPCYLVLNVKTTQPGGNGATMTRPYPVHNDGVDFLGLNARYDVKVIDDKYSGTTYIYRIRRLNKTTDTLYYKAHSGANFAVFPEMNGSQPVNIRQLTTVSAGSLNSYTTGVWLRSNTISILNLFVQSTNRVMLISREYLPCTPANLKFYGIE